MKRKQFPNQTQERKKLRMEEERSVARENMETVLRMGEIRGLLGK